MGLTSPQTLHLVKLLLYMKRWRFLWCILVFGSLIANHLAFPLVDSWMGTMGQTFVDLGAEEFAPSNIILAETDKVGPQLKSLFSILKVESGESGSLVERCENPEACQAKMFKVLYGRITTNKFSNYVSYGNNGSANPYVQCQMAHGGELNCPYLGNLAAISQYKEGEAAYRYKRIRFFSLTSRKEGKKVDSVRGANTKCAKHENFEAVFSRTMMLQCMLVVGTISFYFLVSTQVCISDLKQNGFLQLMFQKGLPVSSYWLAIGFITLAEVLAFSVVFILSLAVQCPGFFAPLPMLAVFFTTLCHLLGLTAVGLLFTVTLGSYFYVGLLSMLVAIATMAIMLVNRLTLGTMTWLKFILLLVFPLGHFGEFVQAALLAEIRLESLGMYSIAIMVLNLLLPITLACAILLLDFTLPTGNGFRLPRNFFTRREFWADPPAVSVDERDDPLYGEEPEPCANVEAVAESLRPLVRLSQLSKTFTSTRMCRPDSCVVAIKDTSALIYENHITAIIGHNGAGKTTMLNLLNGMETPTTGRVSICGILASSPLERLRLRGLIGICPQSQSFAGALTVEQTIRLTVCSCGKDWEENEAEVVGMLKVLGLRNKRSHLMGQLSAGQQRKLAVVVALLGNPKVIFLDEPTTGLDPESRRRMWSLLQEFRLGRCVILSTQFMDEADTLADRKIFISGGALICAGSSLFLKSAFDCGFVFDVTLKAEKHAQLLQKQITAEFKSVRARSRLGKNLNFRLPAKDINFLPALAQSLEKRMELISAFGLLQASLYDIFMRLKDMNQKQVEELFNEDRVGQATLEEEASEVTSLEDVDRRTRLTSVMSRQEDDRMLHPSLLRQLKAMIVVNVMRLIRTRLRLACRVIVPAFLLLALIVTAAVERTKANHQLHLRTDMTNSGATFKRGVCVYDYRSTFVPTLGAFFQMLILAFMPATFLDDIIEDKECRVRYQLASIGMGCTIYWLTNFVIHWLQYSIVYSLSVFLLLAIVQTGYSSAYFMAGVYLPTLFCGLSSNQLMVYVLSTLMQRANHLVTIMYFFFSIFIALVILLVQLNNFASIILIALLPPYATISLIFYGAKTVFYTLSYHKADNLANITSIDSGFYFSQPHVLAAFVASMVHTVILVTILMLIENQVVLLQMLESYLKLNVAADREEVSEDPGVTEETERVNANPRSQENMLEVRHLHKTYPNGSKVLRDVSFATGPAEVFGLLGPNGAGKSTTLSMIVGQLRTTSGRCEVCYRGDWMPSGLAATRGAIGYCPQFDPLYGCLGTLEHLQFYAAIMGVPADTTKTQIDALVDGLSLDITEGKLVSQLSLGSRRRLSLAISLLGEPAILVIDEATTGVDPEGKRFLWQAIRTAATLQCSVIVTTHSMEEVEAICSRVSVLNRGLMVGLGTVQQLRTRYGRSYSLEVLIETAIGESPEIVQLKKDALVSAVTKKFASTSIIEEFNDRVHFSIPVSSIGRLSAALSWLLDNRNLLRINYFSFHQMSMDQVFERMVKLHDRQIKAQRRASVFSLSSQSEGSSAA